MEKSAPTLTRTHPHHDSHDARQTACTLSQARRGIATELAKARAEREELRAEMSTLVGRDARGPASSPGPVEACPLGPL